MKNTRVHTCEKVDTRGHVCCKPAAAIIHPHSGNDWYACPEHADKLDATTPSPVEWLDDWFDGMTITIYGHTLPVADLAHAEAIKAHANTLLDDDGSATDELYQWLYAGAPLPSEGDDETAKCRDCGRHYTFAELTPMVDPTTDEHGEQDQDDYLLCESCLDDRDEGGAR